MQYYVSKLNGLIYDGSEFEEVRERAMEQGEEFEQFDSYSAAITFVDEHTDNEGDWCQP